MKDYVAHNNINDYMRELNSGAGTKDDDTDKMEKIISYSEEDIKRE